MRSKARVRVQLDLPASEVSVLDTIRDRLELGSRAEAVRAALAVMRWVDAEAGRGRRVFSVGNDEISHLTLPGIVFGKEST